MKILQIASLLILAPLLGRAEIIAPSNRIDWVEGHTVGVQGGITWRTTIFTNYYVTNTASEINAGLAAAPSNSVVMLNEEGVFVTHPTTILIPKSGVSLRGLGTNTVIFGPVQAGMDPSGSYEEFSITNGGAKGTTNFMVNRLLDQFGSSISVGDAVWITATENPTNEIFQYISTYGFSNTIKQPALISKISGNTISVNIPLVWDFTNNPKMIMMNLPASGALGFKPLQRVGIENLTIVATNAGSVLSSQNTLIMKMLANSWVTNVNVLYANNYNFFFQYNISCTVVNSQFRFSLGGGSNHAGWLLANDGGCLFMNNIIADGLTPAIEFNDGFLGNAVVYNFETNNLIAIDMHNAHPMMNLWEGNEFSNFIMDGYFGSSSHQTLFRNRSYGTMAYKRWTTFMQSVGNVLGSTNFLFDYIAEEVPAPSRYGLFDFGRPNIGNSDFTGISGPIPWNFPGTNFMLNDNSITTNYPNGVVTFTNSQGPTNVIYGDFTNKVPSYQWWPTVVPPIAFRDGSNPLIYHLGVSNRSVTVLTNLGDRLLLNNPVHIHSNWTLFITGPVAYQQLQSSNKHTHNLHGNAVMTNQSTFVTVWDPANADHTLPASLIFQTKPGWMGTNRFPAFGPDQSPVEATFAARNKYYGIDNGVDQTPPGVPTVSALACATSVRLTWIPSGSAATTYFVQRGTTSGMLTTVTNLGNQLSWTNTDLSNGTEYFYTVIASNIYGASSASSEVIATPVAAPSAPTGLAIVFGDQKATLSWNTVSGASGYIVRRGTSSGALTMIATVTSLGYTNTGLVNGTTYFYDVAAFNTCDTGSYTSEQSGAPAAALTGATKEKKINRSLRLRIGR